jgi:sec-independent protein translocase protein TatA
MRALEPWHLIVLLAVILVLFGGKRLPDAARGLGRSMRIFKSEVKQMKDDERPSPSRPTTPVEGRVVDPADAPRREQQPADVPPADRRDSGV